MHFLYTCARRLRRLAQVVSVVKLRPSWLEVGGMEVGWVRLASPGVCATPPGPHFTATVRYGSHPNKGSLLPEVGGMSKGKRAHG